MSVLNQAQEGKLPAQRRRGPKKKAIEKHEDCPCCLRATNKCPEEENLFYCPECAVHVRNGQVVTTTKEGKFEEPLGHIGPRLRVIKSEEKPEPQKTADPQDIDFYFSSGDKKGFTNVTAIPPQDGWIVLEIYPGENAVEGEVQNKVAAIDFYFQSGNKKRFGGVAEWTFRGPWIILTRPNFKEVGIPAKNVNCFITESKIYINSSNINYLEEV